MSDDTEIYMYPCGKRASPTFNFARKQCAAASTRLARSVAWEFLADGTKYLVIVHVNLIGVRAWRCWLIDGID